MTLAIRRARPDDAPAIAAVHVAAWRSAYAGLLPDDYLASLSEQRQSAGYLRGILERRDGHAVFVACTAPDTERARGGVVGFVSGGRCRRPSLAEGEVETLYVLDDFRDVGLGRRLMRAMGAHLGAVGCRSVAVWVLRDNPARWFYQRLSGRPAAQEEIGYAGHRLMQVAYRWAPLQTLLTATEPARGG